MLKVDTWLNHSACLADTLFLRAYSEAPVIEADTDLTYPCAWRTSLPAVLWQERDGLCEAGARWQRCGWEGDADPAAVPPVVPARGAGLRPDRSGGASAAVGTTRCSELSACSSVRPGHCSLDVMVY